MVSKLFMKLQIDQVTMMAAVVILAVMSFVTTVAARSASTAASRAEVAVQAEKDNSAVLNALKALNEAGNERADGAARAVVTYIRCIALIPEPAESRQELRAQLDDCAVQAGLEEGPTPVPPTTTTSSTTSTTGRTS